MKISDFSHGFVAFAPKQTRILAGGPKCLFPRTGRKEMRVNMKKRTTKIILIAAVGIIVLVFLFSSFTIIPTGYSGVRTTFGQIDSITVQNGFNWKIPFVQSIAKVNIKQQDVTFTEQIWSETSERTALFFEGVTVTYQIHPEKSAWIFANVSDYSDNLVSSGLVSSSVKSASKTLVDTDVTNRSMVEPRIHDSLQASLDDKYGKETVVVRKVVVSNVDFQPSYNDAISAKQAAKLEAERQEIENQKNIDRAKAEADARLIQAQADADAKEIEAQAQADANRKLSDSITDEVLRNRFYDKWDGRLPAVVDSGEKMLDVTGLIPDSPSDTTPSVTENNPTE